MKNVCCIRPLPPLYLPSGKYGVGGSVPQRSQVRPRSRQLPICASDPCVPLGRLLGLVWRGGSFLICWVVGTKDHHAFSLTGTATFGIGESRKIPTRAEIDLAGKGWENSIRPLLPLYLPSRRHGGLRPTTKAWCREMKSPYTRSLRAVGQRPDSGLRDR